MQSIHVVVFVKFVCLANENLVKGKGSGFI